jgi:hypothetical protein
VLETRAVFLDDRGELPCARDTLNTRARQESAPYFDAHAREMAA